MGVIEAAKKNRRKRKDRKWDDSSSSSSSSDSEAVTSAIEPLELGMMDASNSEVVEQLNDVDPF